MWAFLAQLLIALVLLAFFLVSCQNVMHIVRGSVRFLLKHAHRELDKELGESPGLADDEEALSARVVRRRVLLKGNEALHLPGEQVTEEQFTDDQGNIITKKIIRKVVRQLGPGDMGDRQEQEELILEGSLQEPQDLEAEDDHFMKYSILHRDGLGAKPLLTWLTASTRRSTRAQPSQDTRSLLWRRRLSRPSTWRVRKEHGWPILLA
ncbi:ankyrin-1 isoform X9 [Vidua macroura]|uniref:ankyrin-1 isoform X9 n=1 Tax=Vidua macroura TaxID=187451 RepID=UPI0023A88BAC|nr:ankyrin-1 isoform X9 [Vidua macroura]